MSDNQIPETASPIDDIIEITQDVSARVQELMRKVDRLPPGTYDLTIVKPETRALDWKIDIVRIEKIESLRLSKYMAE